MRRPLRPKSQRTTPKASCADTIPLNAARAKTREFSFRPVIEQMTRLLGERSAARPLAHFDLGVNLLANRLPEYGGRASESAQDAISRSARFSANKHRKSASLTRTRKRNR